MQVLGVLVLVAATVVLGQAGQAGQASSCSSDELVVYGVYLDTHWGRELFPKQYPEWRPPAGWSKLIGRTHDSSYWLFREGQPATPGFQVFSEKGQSDGLEAADHSGVYDEFTAPPVPRGEGRTMADFFLDGNHSLVSVAVRVVPSPDWFIGVDSLDLCRGNHWIDSIAIEVDPMDAGTDNGFTFTAPNWPSEPKEPVSRITSKRPNHPANSFYYPKLDKLPSIATITFVKCESTRPLQNCSTALASAHAPTTPVRSEEPATSSPKTVTSTPTTSTLKSTTPTLKSTTSTPTPLTSADTPVASTSSTPTSVMETTEQNCNVSACHARQRRDLKATNPTTEVLDSVTSTATSRPSTMAPTKPLETTTAVETSSRRQRWQRGHQHPHACPSQIPRLTPTFAQEEIDELDDLMEERVYHLSMELSRYNSSRESLATLASLDGNEISNDLGPGTAPGGTGLGTGTTLGTESAARRTATSKARRSRKGSRQAKHCQVSEWSPWSPCSVSCGVGDATRSRRVLEHPRRGGRPCPPLQERRWCGGHSECPQNFFNW